MTVVVSALAWTIGTVGVADVAGVATDWLAVAADAGAAGLCAGGAALEVVAGAAASGLIFEW